MPPLAIALLPLIPQAINSLLQMIDVIKAHETTPDETKAYLDGLSADLAALNEKVQAAPIPD